MRIINNFLTSENIRTFVQRVHEKRHMDITEKILLQTILMTTKNNIRIRTSYEITKESITKLIGGYTLLSNFAIEYLKKKIIYQEKLKAIRSLKEYGVRKGSPIREILLYDFEFAKKSYREIRDALKRELDRSDIETGKIINKLTQPGSIWG